MGILYNRFNESPQPVSDSWELVKTFTEVNTQVSVDITGKTEMLVVCNDIVTMIFAVLPASAYSSTYSEEYQYAEKAYNTNTGTGYSFAVYFRPNSAKLEIRGSQWTGVSTKTALSSVNTKVYMR